MIDNMKVKAMKKEGIKRVDGIGKTMQKGQGGKLNGHRNCNGGSYKRADGKMTPSRA